VDQLQQTAWVPSKKYMENTILYQWMKKLNYDSFDDFYADSIKDIGWFWNEVNKDMELAWYQDYDQTVDLSGGFQWPKWFVNGKLNVTQNCLEKWADYPNIYNKNAIIWEGEDGRVRTYTYRELSQEVNAVAGGLRKQGIQKGDRVMIYMPLIPETIIAILALSKIGAIYTPAFSGYGAEALRQRLISSGAKMMITADGFYRRGKKVQMKNEAINAISSTQVEKVVVVHRLEERNEAKSIHEIDWSHLLVDSPSQHCETEQMGSDEPLMLLYTSGTTGKPKGIIHTHSGFPIKSASDARYGMDLRAEDTMFWVTDMGWMMGPFLLYSTLMNGSTMVLFEGSPDYPQPNRVWHVVEKHKVTHLGISPTLIRSLMQHGEQWLSEIDLSTLRVIGSTGEPWNYDPWLWLFQKVGKSKIPIVNYSGGTEISGGILGNSLLKQITPMSFNSPFLGMDADVVDGEKKSVRNSVGELVLKQPWVGMANGFWQDPKRYENTYWSRWSDTWLHGDWARKDEEGYWHITGRSDDTLNIAGKRMGPAEMESVLVAHDEVVEAAVIGVPDKIKGEAAVCFVVRRESSTDSQKLVASLLHWIGEKLGKAMRPKSIFFVTEIPKTRNAKVMRRVIRSAFLGEETGDLSALENPSAVEQIRQTGLEYTGG
jgi:acetyl-CoA synthetase